MTDLTREKINEYIWAKYIDNTKPPTEIDEEQALHFFERFYGKHPLNQDEECFYYGILLYERSFSDEANRARYLVKAKEVFECYRNITGETEWDVVEDRLADVLDIIESENLLESVQTAADLAPEIPGMVLIPSGPFPFGTEGEETFLEPYYIDIYPVTNKEYRRFIEETDYRRPRIWDKRPEFAEDDLPVTGVSWMDALQYCKWAGKSLPTAAQWEKAARGPQGHLYPWGDEPPTPEKANYRVDQYGEARLRPVDAFPDGASPYGVQDMVGGVWEWTNTPYEEEESSQIVKGGSYVDLPQYPPLLSATANLWANKKEKNDVIGFRCTRPLDQ
ncbi:MAG: hypothetical protein D6731_21455 [Planctomycetota bacterium]|nr:MAG: hypothetical protein D6731_21455 [Planctomycetota bacterium]